MYICKLGTKAKQHSTSSRYSTSKPFCLLVILCFCQALESQVRFSITQKSGGRMNCDFEQLLGNKTNLFYCLETVGILGQKHNLFCHQVAVRKIIWLHLPVSAYQKHDITRKIKMLSKTSTWLNPLYITACNSDTILTPILFHSCLRL